MNKLQLEELKELLKEFRKYHCETIEESKAVFDMLIRISYQIRLLEKLNK